MMRASPFLFMQARILVVFAPLGTIFFHLTRLSLGLQRPVLLTM
jgi:hypothetical protein